MKKLRRDVFIAAGAYTVSLGTGRREFNPRKPRPGLEEYIIEAGQASLAQISNPELIDEGVIANFMAARFNRQGNLAGFMPIIHPSLEFKPMVRVEGACGSGGLGVATGIKSVLAETADAVLVVGVEVQNTVKAVYGADILATAGYHAGERKEGHTYFFPNKFSMRAGAYYEKYGKEKARKGMATWYKNAVDNARLNPLAQEHHNQAADLMALGMTPPDGRFFTDHLNLFDCSKVSDGAASLIVCSEEGYKKLGLTRADVVQVVGLGQAEANLTTPPPVLTELTTSRVASQNAMKMAGLALSDIDVFEVHDCFTITGLLAVEMLGIAQPGEGADVVASGATTLTGAYPMNTGGGLVGYGHPVGASGVRMAVDVWKQLTGKAGAFQVPKPVQHGLFLSMGGDDKTVVSAVLKK